MEFTIFAPTKNLSMAMAIDSALAYRLNKVKVRQDYEKDSFNVGNGGFGLAHRHRAGRYVFRADKEQC